MLFYTSTQPFHAAPSLDGLSRASLSNYSALFDSDALEGALALACARRRRCNRSYGRNDRRGLGGGPESKARECLLDVLVSLPLAIPGLVVGVALLVVYVGSPLPVYGTLWILFLAYFTRFMPYAIRYAAVAMHQVGGELEEAARVSGAGLGQTLRHVTLPLVLPGLAAGWLYVLMLTMRDLSSSLLLYSPGNEVLPVRIYTLYDNGRFGQLAAVSVLLVMLMTVLGLAAYRLGTRAQD